MQTAVHDMSKDQTFRLRLDASDRERLDVVAAAYSAPASTAIRMLIKEKYDLISRPGAEYARMNLTVDDLATLAGCTTAEMLTRLRAGNALEATDEGFVRLPGGSSKSGVVVAGMLRVDSPKAGAAKKAPKVKAKARPTK
jgi:hypothetical protein